MAGVTAVGWHPTPEQGFGALGPSLLELLCCGGERVLRKQRSKAFEEMVVFLSEPLQEFVNRQESKEREQIKEG